MKQSAALRQDLDAFADAGGSPALQGAAPGNLSLRLKVNRSPGQISATLTSFSRTVDDYYETSKKELNAAKQEKARERVKNFRSEMMDYRQTFDRLKKDREDNVGSQTGNDARRRVSDESFIPIGKQPKPHRAPGPPATPCLDPREPVCPEQPAHELGIRTNLRELHVVWLESESAKLLSGVTRPARTVVFPTRQCTTRRVSGAWSSRSG